MLTSAPGGCAEPASDALPLRDARDDGGDGGADGGGVRLPASLEWLSGERERDAPRGAPPARTRRCDTPTLKEPSRRAPKRVRPRHARTSESAAAAATTPPAASPAADKGQ